MTIPQIHKGKTPIRRHYLVEWAAKFDMKQADVARATGADKGLVSKWFKGVLPGEAYLEQLAALFHTERDALFRHPDEDWLAKFFRDRLHGEEERKRALRILNEAFPKSSRS